MVGNRTTANPVTAQKKEALSGKFRIFRNADAVDMRESGRVSYSNLDAQRQLALRQIQDAGGEEGSETEHIFAGGGMSLGRVWFKSGFPLILHSHDSNCLYYITAGSLRLGTNTLGVGDGFFVPADVPYTYTAGDEGVELLEFRNAEGYDFKLASRSSKYYEQIAQVLTSRVHIWSDEDRPGREATAASAAAF
ncbi:MAG: hypothetical protein NVS3B5_00560 [Sphingomicrobium sp.]